MRVAMLGHACLLCQTEDATILMDPWLVGPANFRSWWHLPDVDIDPLTLPAPNYIYLSHLHGDHFHVPTLERLDRRATVLVPKLYHRRMVDRLRQLGFERIVELPHGKEVPLTRLTRVCCLQMGNDSLLAVADSDSSMLNANDCLQGNHPAVTFPALRRLATRYRFDIAFLAFGTAGPHPKCYHYEDPGSRLDPWVKERAMLSNFVKGAQAAQARLTVPFAGGFALLAREQMWMNEVKTTPIDALAALKAKAPDLAGADMNPGDFWDSREGLVRVHPGVPWERRIELIRAMHQAHAGELAQIEQEDRQGPADLRERFESRLTANLRSFPFLRRRMNCPVLFDVQGHPGGLWEVDLRRASRWFRESDSGDWLIRLTIPSGLLAQVLSDPDGWETLGISYKLNLYVRRGGRSKEGLLNRLIHTPSPLWVLQSMASPRFLEFVLRRRSEFWRFMQDKLFSAA